MCFLNKHDNWVSLVDNDVTFGKRRKIQLFGRVTSCKFPPFARSRKAMHSEPLSCSMKSQRTPMSTGIFFSSMWLRTISSCL